MAFFFGPDVSFRCRGYGIRPFQGLMGPLPFEGFSGPSSFQGFWMVNMSNPNGGLQTPKPDTSLPPGLAHIGWGWPKFGGFFPRVLQAADKILVQSKFERLFSSDFLNNPFPLPPCP